MGRRAAAAALIAVSFAALASAPPASAARCDDAANARGRWVNCMLDRMSIREKVGQMFVVNGFGQTVAATDPATVAANNTLYGPGVDNLEDLIETYRPGGIVYFSWSNNLAGGPAQILGLSNGIQEVALDQPSSAPMLISIDQEEGEVLRIGAPATVFPGNMALGAARSVPLAFENAAITGQELRAMGINVDNAPVVDVNTNPLNAADGIRSFGDRVNFVSKFTTAAVNGYEGPGQVSAVAKHWPGLGDTSTNPDDGVSTTEQTLDEMRRVNFPSFEAAIEAGVDSVMVTHMLTPNVPGSDGLPTTFNRRFVTDLLRGSLDFNGVVITDALNAQALADYTAPQIALNSIRAGNDQLLELGGFPKVTPADLPAAHEAVMDAVREGDVTKNRIEQSARRILAQKWKLGLATDPFADPDELDKIVGTPEHLDVARRTAERSITLLKNSGDLLPLDLAPGARVLVASAGWGQTSTPQIAGEIAARGLTTQPLVTSPEPTPAQIEQAQAAAAQSELVVVNAFNVWSSQPSGQVQLIEALQETGKPVIVTAVGTPYDIAYLRDVTAFVAVHDFQRVSIDAMVATLFGEVEPTGELPVTIRDPENPGTILYPFGFGLRYTPPTPPVSPLTCMGEQATQLGGSDSDIIEGTDGPDVIVAMGGDDRILAGGGDDIVCANGGGDRLLGQGGADILKGSGGVDLLHGGGGVDACNGGEGRDAEESC
jgi:beta-N-acetylhexosaminidase